MQTTRPLVPQAEFQRVCEFAFDGQIGLLRVAVDEVLRHRKRERQDPKRESYIQIILIRKERTRGKGIETLLIWFIPQRQGGRNRQVNRVGVEHSLKDRRTVQ